MLVNKFMVKDLLDSFVNDMHFSGINVTLIRKDSVNDEARKTSQLYKSQHYNSQTGSDLWMEGVRIYQTLKSQGIELNDDMLKEHAWIRKYLPIFSSEIFSRMMDNYRSTYNFSETDEIILQSATACMLAYHSNPSLFDKDPEAFEALATIWSEALLTFNCRKMPMFEQEIAGWHDRPYYSTDRNLIFFKFCAEQYLKISQKFSDLLGLEKWHKRVVAFDAIINMLPFVVADHDKMKSHSFYDAIKACQNLEAHVSELHNTPPLPAYAPPKNEVEPTDMAAAAASVAPVYRTPEEQELNEAGKKLIQDGMRNLFLAQSALDSHPEVRDNLDDTNEETCTLL